MWGVPLLDHKRQPNSPTLVGNLLRVSVRLVEFVQHLLGSKWPGIGRNVHSMNRKGIHVCPSAILPPLKGNGILRKVATFRSKMKWSNKQPIDLHFVELQFILWKWSLESFTCFPDRGSEYYWKSTLFKILNNMRNSRTTQVETSMGMAWSWLGCSTRGMTGNWRRFSLSITDNDWLSS